MCSYAELNKELDALPLETPYEMIAKLRELHSLLHNAAQIDEGVPFSMVSIAECIEMLKNIEPTHLKQALDLEGDVLSLTERNIFFGWSGPVLELSFALRTRHIPPEKINHNY